MMNKILIIGHPNSGYHDVEHLLHNHGMQKPNSSQREGFQAEEISSILCQAHNAKDLSGITSEKDIRQIDVGPVWNGMALDLLLGNLESSIWGWSDPQSIFLLDYWKTLDPSMIFMMVYDSPARVLQEQTRDDIHSCSNETAQGFLDNWNAYNGHLLHFYLRNRDRCFMVHARRASSETTGYLEALNAHLDLQLTSGTNGHTLDVASQTTRKNGITHPAAGSIIPRPTAAEVDAFFMEHIMEAFPAYRQRYEELESSADLPLQEAQNTTASPLAAWLGYMQQQAKTSDLVSQLSAMQTLYTDKLNHSNEELQNLKSELDDLEQQLQDKTSTLDDVSGENELLLSQLHQVQEELERYYLDNQCLKQQYEPDYYGAADRLKSELPYQLGAAIIERSHKVWPLAFLPFSITRLARQYKKEHQTKEKLPPLTEYRDYHEAEKAQQHLSYRLGNEWLKHSSTPWGWAVMPFTLTKAYREFRAYRALKDN